MRECTERRFSSLLSIKTPWQTGGQRMLLSYIVNHISSGSQQHRALLPAPRAAAALIQPCFYGSRSLFFEACSLWVWGEVLVQMLVKCMLPLSGVFICCFGIPSLQQAWTWSLLAYIQFSYKITSPGKAVGLHMQGKAAAQVLWKWTWALQLFLPTSLSPLSLLSISLFDSPAERYQKVRQSVQRFTITQLGECHAGRKQPSGDWCFLPLSQAIGTDLYRIWGLVVWFVKHTQ